MTCKTMIKDSSSSKGVKVHCGVCDLAKTKYKKKKKNYQSTTRSTSMLLIYAIIVLIVRFSSNGQQKKSADKESRSLDTKKTDCWFVIKQLP